jgi:hypothetical protein
MGFAGVVAWAYLIFGLAYGILALGVCLVIIGVGQALNESAEETDGIRTGVGEDPGNGHA